MTIRTTTNESFTPPSPKMGIGGFRDKSAQCDVVASQVASLLLITLY